MNVVSNESSENQQTNQNEFLYSMESECKPYGEW